MHSLRLATHQLHFDPSHGCVDIPQPLVQFPLAAVQQARRVGRPVLLRRPHGRVKALDCRRISISLSRSKSKPTCTTNEARSVSTSRLIIITIALAGNIIMNSIKIVCAPAPMRYALH